MSTSTTTESPSYSQGLVERIADENSVFNRLVAEATAANSPEVDATMANDALSFAVAAFMRNGITEPAFFALICAAAWAEMQDVAESAGVEFSYSESGYDSEGSYFQGDEASWG